MPKFHVKQSESTNLSTIFVAIFFALASDQGICCPAPGESSGQLIVCKTTFQPILYNFMHLYAFMFLTFLNPLILFGIFLFPQTGRLHISHWHWIPPLRQALVLQAFEWRPGKIPSPPCLAIGDTSIPVMCSNSQSKSSREGTLAASMPSTKLPESNNWIRAFTTCMTFS